MRPAKVPQVRTLACPNCGGTVELKGYAQSINAICIQCLTVLDTRTPSLEVLQTFGGRERIQPLIPLGTRGRFGNVQYEVVGFQVRAIEVDGIEYSWHEYLLLNPYRGYLYLTQYDGHWNLTRTLRAIPSPASAGRKRAVEYQGVKYTHFQTATARTTYVMGEFPWQVRVDESQVVEDFIAPPRVLSAELTQGEAVWSIGEYTPGAQIWQAFGLQGSPPRPIGIYANQPSPFKGRVASIWGLGTLFFALLFVTGLVIAGMNYPREVFRQQYTFSTLVRGEQSFVTPAFELSGRTSNVEVAIDTSLSNDWASFALALINDETGQAFDTGKEISYYFGSDSDGAWTEGSRRGSVTITQVPAGRYYLRVEPEMDDDAQVHMMNYNIVVKRGGIQGFFFIAAFFLLLIPPIALTWRAFQFENMRWAESDYGALVTSSSGDDE